MGAADGTAPGRVAEFDGNCISWRNHFGALSMFQEWPEDAPAGRIQPARHLRASGSEPDDDLGLHPAEQHADGLGRVLSCAVPCASGITGSAKLSRPSNLTSPDGGPALGTMDVKMLPKDPMRYRLHRGNVRRPYLRDRSDRGHGRGGVRLANRDAAREDRCQRRNGPDSGDSAKRRSADCRPVPGRAGGHARHHGTRQPEAGVGCQLRPATADRTTWC